MITIKTVAVIVTFFQSILIKLVLNSLKNFKKVAVFGVSFKNKLDSNIIIKKCKTHEEQRYAYSISKINLELPFFSGACSFMKNRYHFKNRFFEIPATGNFLLSLRYPQFFIF